MTPEEVRERIEDGFEDADVEVVEEEHEDERSDGAHFGLVVVSDEFDGMSRVDRHRAVYDALGDAMGGDIHAVEISARAPDEAEG
jgi:BolA protein